MRIGPDLPRGRGRIIGERRERHPLAFVVGVVLHNGLVRGRERYARTDALRSHHDLTHRHRDRDAAPYLARAEPQGVRAMGRIHGRRGSCAIYRPRPAAIGGLAWHLHPGRLLAPAGLCNVLGVREGKQSLGRSRGPMDAPPVAGTGSGLGRDP